MVTLNEQLLYRDSVRRLADMIEWYLDLEQQPSLNKNQEKIRDKFGSILNKATGVLGGHYEEFLEYRKFIGKNQSVHTGHADVTIGEPGDAFAKSVQHKSTISGDAKQVSSMIAAAANQISGERKEFPRPGDRLIIDVAIQNNENPWPFDVDTGPSLVAYLQQACQRLQADLSTYSQHAKGKPGIGINPTTMARLTDVNKLTGQSLSSFRAFDAKATSHAKSTLAVATVNSVPTRIDVITIKIRYPVKSFVVGEGVGFKFLTKAVFVACARGALPVLEVHPLELIFGLSGTDRRSYTVAL